MVLSESLRSSQLSLRLYLIRVDSNLHQQIVGFSMGTICAPLVADLFLFCYEGNFMLSFSDDTQSEVIEAFNSTSRYLDDLLILIITSLIACSIIFTIQSFR